MLKKLYSKFLQYKNEKSLSYHIKRSIFLRTKWVYNFISPFTKVKKNKIVFSNFWGRGYGCNPKYIAQYIIEHNLPFKLYWLIDKQKCKNETYLPKEIKEVDINSFGALYHLSTAFVWIDNSRKFLYPPKKKSQLYIQTWHGNVGPKKIEKSAENNLEDWYKKNAKKDSQMIDLCISGSSHLTQIYKNDFWYSGQVLESGYPRTDILFNDTKIQNLKCELGYFDKKICIYAPTFRNNNSLKPYNLDYGKLKTSLESKFGGNWIIFLRFHPNMNDFININLPDFVVNVSQYSDVQELMAISDCMITDYSSIIFEFMLTKRPAFIYASDLNEYKKNERSFYFTLDSTPFSLAKDNNELSNNIINFNNIEYQKKIFAFSNKMHIFDDGKSSERIIKWIEQKQIGR